MSALPAMVPLPAQMTIRVQGDPGQPVLLSLRGELVDAFFLIEAIRPQPIEEHALDDGQALAIQADDMARPWFVFRSRPIQWDS